MTDLSEQLDECIYPKTEEVLYSSPDGEVLEAIYLVEFQHDEDSKVPIALNKIAEAYSLDVADCEVFDGADEEYPHIALTVRGTVKSIRALSSEFDRAPDVLKRLMTTNGPESATQGPQWRDRPAASRPRICRAAPVGKPQGVKEKMLRLGRTVMTSSPDRSSNGLTARQSQNRLKTAVVARSPAHSNMAGMAKTHHRLAGTKSAGASRS